MVPLGNASNGATAAKGFSVNNGNVVGVLSNNQAFRWTPGTGVVRIDPTNTGQGNGVNTNGSQSGPTLPPEIFLKHGHQVLLMYRPHH